MADLVAAVPALRAPLPPTVDGAQVLQHEREIGAFTLSYHMIDLAAVHAARYRVVTNPAGRAVRLVDEAAQVFPPVPTEAHRSAGSRLNSHDNMIGELVDEQYAGLIKAPEDWWVCSSRRVFDAWDWPAGPLRDMVLSAAKDSGVLRRLGPSSMTTAQAMVMARRMRFGEETTEEDALEGFRPTTMRGYDFLNNRGEFADDEEGE